MPTRSIKLKLIVPRQPGRREIARHLWTTHCLVNEAVHYYETRLLWLRGDAYKVSDEKSISAEEVQVLRRELVSEALGRNGFLHGAEPPADHLSEAERLLRALYDAIVPSILGRHCSAQAVGGFVSPLMDPTSEGFSSVFEKIGNAPDWVEGVRNGEAEALDAAQQWLQTEQGQRRLKATGAPPNWAKLAGKCDPSWPAAFVRDLDRKLEQAKGVPTLIRRLRGLRVLPIFEPYLSRRIDNAQSVVGPWDRLAMRLAVAHLCSWESWCRLAAKEHGARLERVQTFQDRHLTDDIQPAIEALRRYERERTEYQSQLGLPMVRDFKITGRMVRSWPDLRDRWRASSDQSEQALIDIAAKEQTRLQGRFGDPHLFHWLAKPSHHYIWASQEADSVGLISRLNVMERVLERSRETALMTLPDAIEHPRSAQWEAQGGSNLRNYKLAQDKAGQLQVTLPVLGIEEDGRIIDQELVLQLAPSDQFQRVELGRDGKPVKVQYRDASGQRYVGELGSADLLLNWDYLRHRRQHIQGIELGDIGPAYLKLALDLQPALPEGWELKRPKGASFFQSARTPNKRNKHQDDVYPGMRVLSVDLGIRGFASCSVFELTDRQPGNSVVFPVDELGWWAVHERSFILDLPDERLGRRALGWQQDAEEELRQLRRGLGRYRAYYPLAGLAPEERALPLQQLQTALETVEPWPFEPAVLERLQVSQDAPQLVWDDRVRQALYEYRGHFGLLVHDWRRRTRPRDRFQREGKTMWSIQHLTNARRFLQSWSLLGRSTGDIRRLDRERGGIFASRLLEHLNNIKEDRLKTGSDLIIQAARGYRRNPDGRWHQAYDPCQIVLFEDLSRYRMRTDRPRRENSALMKWAHRSVPEEVAMQGQLYGIHTAETSADFSSRFHAATHTPGIRCHELSRADLQDDFFRKLVERENPRIDLGSLRGGDIVPMPGGEWFVCVKPAGLTRIQADINAAQNLQRRFWTRHKDAFRLPCVQVTVDGESYWVPRSMGKRVLGALGGHGYLVPTGHDSGSARWHFTTPAKWRKWAGASGQADEDKADESAELEELTGMEEEELERSGTVVVFFRDPSGIVLPADLWVPQKTFWSMVKSKTAKFLRAPVAEVVEPR